MRSVQGDIRTRAAGRFMLLSRKYPARASESPPPAESPATIILLPLYPMSSSHLYAVTASSKAAGYGFSGATR